MNETEHQNTYAYLKVRDDVIPSKSPEESIVFRGVPVTYRIVCLITRRMGFVARSRMGWTWLHIDFAPMYAPLALAGSSLSPVSWRAPRDAPSFPQAVEHLLTTMRGLCDTPETRSHRDVWALRGTQRNKRPFNGKDWPDAYA